jgi:transcriptional regulator with XRE-family HTH domain
MYLKLHFKKIFVLIVNMKKTPEDQDYAYRFGYRLEKAYSSAKSQGITDAVFADSIGVERSALKKYLLGKSTPSLRTVALAKCRYNIDVPYGETELGGILKRSKHMPQPIPRQLRLPIAISVAHPDKFEVELRQLRSSKYELRISSKSAPSVAKPKQRRA